MMNEMVGSILAFARDDTKDEPRSFVGLSALVEGICQDASDAGEPVTSSGPGGVTTSCRAASLRRAISNFIDNAVKYVGPATVSLAPEAYLTMTHRHYETFELPEVPDRLLPDKLAITFLTNRDGDIVSLSAPLEPMVKDIVFVRLAAGDCTDAAFRDRCVGSFRGGSTTHRVTLDTEGRLVLKPDNQPAYHLAPEASSSNFAVMGRSPIQCSFIGRAANGRNRPTSRSLCGY